MPKRRILFAVLIGCALGSPFVIPLLQLRWYEGAFPFGWREPVPVADRPTGAEADIARETVSLTWQERKGERPAPAVALRVAPTDWSGWWSPLLATRTLKVTTRGPEMLLLEASVPGIDGVRPEDVAPLCAGDSEPDACRLSRGRLVAFRDDTDWDRQDILLGRKAPVSDVRTAADGRTLPAVLSYWVHDDEPRKSEAFAGWDCATEAAAGVPPQAIEASVAALGRCFEPGRWWSRRWPTLFGFRKQRLLYDCNAQDACEIAFLFRGRLVKLEAQLLPTRDKEAARILLWFSAFGALQRMAANAAATPPGDSELALAQAQIDACEAVVEQLSALPEERLRRALRDSSENANRLLLSCRESAHIAARLPAPSSAVAEELLGRALTAMARVDTLPSQARPWLDIWLALLGSTGQGETPRSLQASLLWLKSNSGSAGDSPEQVRNVRALLSRFGRDLDAPSRQVAYLQVAQQMRSDPSAPDLRPLWREWTAVERASSGAGSSELLRPLNELAYAEWQSGDFAATRTALAQMEDLWLALPLPTDDLSKRRFAAGGANIVQLWRMLASQSETDAVAAGRAVEPVLKRMNEAVGAGNPALRQAEQYQREIAASRKGGR